MARIFTYLMFFVGIIIIAGFLGFDLGFDGSITLFNLATNPSGVTVSDFFGSLFDSDLGVLIAGLALGGIIIGFVLRGQLENFLIIPFITGTLITAIGVFTAVLQDVGQYADWLALPLTLIFGMLTIGFIVSMLEFFRGNT